MEAKGKRPALRSDGTERKWWWSFSDDFSQVAPLPFKAPMYSKHSQGIDSVNYWEP